MRLARAVDLWMGELARAGENREPNGRIGSQAARRRMGWESMKKLAIGEPSPASLNGTGRGGGRIARGFF